MGLLQSRAFVRACKSDQFRAWIDDFKALQLPLVDIERLYKVFMRIDADGSGKVDLLELLNFLDVDRTKFSERVFSIMDEDQSGQINFYEFVMAVWNYCTLSDDALGMFAFDLYDEEGRGVLTTDQVFLMLKEIFGYVVETNLSKSVAADLKAMEVANKPLTIDNFKHFLKTHQAMMFPVFQIQNKLRRKILGARFWHKAANRRIRFSNGKHISVGAFIAFHQSGKKILSIGSTNRLDDPLGTAEVDALAEKIGSKAARRGSMERQNRTQPCSAPSHMEDDPFPSPVRTKPTAGGATATVCTIHPSNSTTTSSTTATAPGEVRAGTPFWPHAGAAARAVAQYSHALNYGALGLFDRISTPVAPAAVVPAVGRRRSSLETIVEVAPPVCRGKDRYRAVEVPVENLHVLPPGQVPTAKKVRTAAEIAKEITPVEIFNPDAFRDAPDFYGVLKQLPPTTRSGINNPAVNLAPPQRPSFQAVGTSFGGGVGVAASAGTSIAAAGNKTTTSATVSAKPKLRGRRRSLGCQPSAESCSSIAYRFKEHNDAYQEYQQSQQLRDTPHPSSKVALQEPGRAMGAGAGQQQQRRSSHDFLGRNRGRRSSFA